MPGPLETLIFETLLKIDPNTIAQYTTIQDQIIFLLLIPHIILFLFIYAFSASVVGRVVGAHRGLRNLIGVAAYVFIVSAGWYGGILIPLFITWFQILLVIAFVVFFISIIFHPARIGPLTDLAGKLGVGESKEEKEREYTIQELKSELNAAKSELAIVSSTFNRESAKSNPDSKMLQYYKMEASQLERKISRLESELRKARGA